MTTSTVQRMEVLLAEVAELQSHYTQKVCSLCEAPCCGRVQYLFDEKDIMYLRLTGRNRKWKRELFRKKGCWFLGPTGCVLDLLSRPFICHNYICDDLEKEMEIHEPGLVGTLREKLRQIGSLRSQLWSEYLEAGIGSKNGKEGTGREADKNNSSFFRDPK